MSREVACQVLQVSPLVSPEELRTTYFERAVDYHPDICGIQDPMFWTLTGAYMALAQEEVSVEKVMEMWLRDFAMGGEGLEQMLMQELHASPALQMQRFIEASEVSVGIIKGERLRCEACGFQVRGQARMRAHFMSKHQADAKAWAMNALERASDSFKSFLSAAGGASDKFRYYDGTEGRLTPGCLTDGTSEMERCLRFDDPCSQEAVLDALAAAPEALAVMQLASPRVASFLSGDPVLQDRVPDLLARASGAGRRVRERSDRDEERAEKDLGCSCGFSCGTETALQLHLARFPRNPLHKGTVT